MLTGIYGGSFNPIHLGHTALATWLVQQGYVDELWLMVSPQNPLKPAQDLMPDAQRLRLANIATKEMKGVRVSDFECRLPRPSFMVNTLEALRVTYPAREFVLIIGADNWQRFGQWHRADDIMAHHNIIIYPRPGFDIDTNTLPQGVTMATEAPRFDISATQIRQALGRADYDGRGLNPDVWNELRTLLHTMPCAIMALATFMKPAMLAPFT